MITVLKMAGHFMNNLYTLLLKIEDSKKHCQVLSRRIKEDITLQRKFLSQASKGISMNILTFRECDHVIIGDASEHGLGAYHLESGRGWSWMIPQELQGRAHINLLEFLTQVIQIWIDIFEGRIQDEDCILAMGDNTTAMGWLRRSHFRETEEDENDWKVKQEVSRKLATLIIDANAMLYTQWFAGKENVCADSLSRDGMYFDSPLTHENFLKSYFPQQTPVTLQIKPVPKNIICFVSSILQQLPVKQQRLTAPKISEPLHGVTGILSCTQSDLAKPSTLKAWINFKRTSSSQHFLKQYEKVPPPSDLKTSWLKEQSMPPSHMWHRPSGQTTGMTPDWTLMAKHAIYSKSNIEATKIRTKGEKSKRRFQHQY